jgi:hypothetical protein
MGVSDRRVVGFLEKEIQTYKPLSLFLSKKGEKQHVRLGASRLLITPLFYKERMEEAKKLVCDLKKSNELASSPPNAASYRAFARMSLLANIGTDGLCA